MTASPLRVAVLFSRLSDYMAACLLALSERHGADLLVVRTAPAENAPFDDRQFAWIDHLHDRDGLDKAAIQRLLDSFTPRAVLMSGWFDRDYLRVARQMRRKGIPVIAGTDAQWRGTMRQEVARKFARWYLHPAIDVLWAAGERQRQFAKRLGYSGSRCWDGVYACNLDRFLQGESVERSRERHFLFVGRYVRAKGLDTLLDAYETYRNSEPDPWTLVCAGTGEMAPMLRHREGVIDLGFIQPDDLPDVMWKAGAFVLASRHEPWGVVVQEAAASALPIVCSDASGASVHLVRDGYNGYLAAAGDAAHLAGCLRRMTSLSETERREMGGRSLELSAQYSPAQWAATFVNGLGNLDVRR